MYYVYIIQSEKSGKYYIGSTDNTDKRLREHNRNQVRATRHRGPYKLVYKEQMETKTEARKKENKIKHYKSNSKFKKLVENLSPSSSLV